ncbi:Cytochrome b [Sphingobium indicum BiD32]|uniref:Cytochrome b n=2 Tax=Sphingobium indicum TaxID=332055 RepID=N1MLQ2_9SPHN|nr:Cytochrome b [Sphingobium indicum BiD32]
MGEEGLIAMARTPRQFVWDLPVRLFHWALVLLIGFSWWSAENYHMDWHRLSGQAVLFLIAFRLIWGVVGSDTARFAHFLKGPRAIRVYLADRNAPAPVGHNPLGGWSVVAMLAVLVMQVVSGLFAVDTDGIESGPLSHLVDFDQGRLASAIHGVVFAGLQALIALHVLAVLFYLAVRRRNLVGPMVTGSAAAPAPISVRRAGPLALVVALLLSTALAWWLFAQSAL